MSYLFFFFSSRRRHTRWPRDWSSDVCSSDLISNTIKLTIMARSREIGIMKLVGATNSFIRGPFFVEGLLLGVFGSFIPIILISVGYKFLTDGLASQTTFHFINILPFNPFVWQLSGILLLIGAFIGVWGCLMSVRKFLRV